MTYNITLNMVKIREWGINLSQATLLELYSKSQSWATEIVKDNQVYYWCAKTKVIEEIPVLTDKTDTVYRLTKELQVAGLIDYLKIDGKDCIRLTEKGKTWNSEKNPNKDNNSEKNPSDLGKKSEYTSEKNPTYNSTNKDNGTRDNSTRKNFEVPSYERLWDIPFSNDFVEKMNNHPKGKAALEKIGELWEVYCKVRYKAHNRKYNTDISEAQALNTFLSKCKNLQHAIDSLEKCIAVEAINPFVIELPQEKKVHYNHFGMDASRFG